MAYKFIASDVDGTLVGEDFGLSQRTIDAISELQRRGLFFTLASGRSLHSMRDYLHLVADDMPLITYNGAKIVMKDGTVLFEEMLDADCVSRIIDLCWGSSVTLIIWAGDRLITNTMSSPLSQYEEMSGESFEVFSDREELRGIRASKVIWNDTLENIQKHVEMLDCVDTHGFTYFTSHPFFLEFVNAAVSKGAAVEKVAGLLGVEREEVIAIGDGMNDQAMLEYAGLGVAMNTAFDKLKTAADVIADSCENDGLAKIIEKYML